MTEKAKSFMAICSALKSAEQTVAKLQRIKEGLRTELLKDGELGISELESLWWES